MKKLLLAVALPGLLLVYAGGCGDEPVGGPPDSGAVGADSGGPGPGGDAGQDAGSDAGPEDGSDAGLDAGFDAGTDAGTDAGWDGGSDAGTGQPVRLRVMAANLTSGNNQSYDPGDGIRIFQGLDPDVVLIQEFNYGTNSDPDLRSFVDLAFGPGFQYARQAGVQIPNGVVSRYPILDSGIWNDPEVSNREFSWARIDVPGPIDLWAVSLHLLTSSATTRNQEAQALVGFIESAVPAGDFLVLGGDFNTSSRGEACISTLSQVVVTSSSSAPYPRDQNGNSDTNASRSKPYDWVLADPDLNPLRTSVEIGSSSYSTGLVFDSRVYSPLSEVSPVQSGDSAAPSMQHMAVVKDFLLPE